MKDWTSKTEATETRHSLERGTEERLREADDRRKEVEDVSRTLDSQGAPIFKETADALNRISEEFEADTDAEMRRQEAAVEGSVEREEVEISDPSREGADAERGEAHGLEAGARGAGGHMEVVLAAAEAHSEASEFLAELADASDAHQRESAEAVRKLTAEAHRAAEAIRRF